MVDKELFLTGINEQVQGYLGAAYVRVIALSSLTDESDYLVHSIVKTYDGSVTLQVWLDVKGQCPIVAGSSSFHEFDVRSVVDYKTVTIPFEHITQVVVMPAITTNGRFKM
jgi:hypothetical protein